MIVLVDMDGVIADFDGGFLDGWRRAHPERAHVPREARTRFRLIDQYPPEEIERVRGVYCAPGFFRGLAPVPGGLDALREMRDAGHEVLLCTSPLERYRNCVLEKYEWVEAHLGVEWTHHMVLTRDKTLVHGDLLIDDNPRIEGRLGPRWEHVLYDQPYNRAVRGHRRLTWASWREVLPELGAAPSLPALSA